LFSFQGKEVGSGRETKGTPEENHGWRRKFTRQISGAGSFSPELYERTPGKEKGTTQTPNFAYI